MLQRIKTIKRKNKLTAKEIANKLKQNPNSIDNLRGMEQYIDKCMKELLVIEPPYQQRKNFGKIGEPAALLQETSDLIYDIIPDLVEDIVNTKPNRKFMFPLNHLLKKVLILCKRCIELDIACFRILELIFGHVHKVNNIYDVDKFNGYHIDTYGNGEFSAIAIEKYINEYILKSTKKVTFYFDPNRYEMSYYIDYPVEDFAYCSYRKSKSNWFQIENINFFGKIGGFKLILKRITYTKCCIALSDLVNLLRPVAVCRDLYGFNYHRTLVSNLEKALIIYCQNLPNIYCKVLNYNTFDKIMMNMHYLMNNAYNIALINDVKRALTLQISFRQINVLDLKAQIAGMDKINAVIEKVLNDKSEFVNTNIRVMQEWIKRRGILAKLLDDINTDKELIKMLYPIFKLLQYDDDTHHIVSLIWFIFQSNKHDAIPLSMMENFLDNCQCLVHGYCNQIGFRYSLNDILKLICGYLVCD